ncbi:MAG TPA: GntR family transcriptional regulator [Candidatus Stackebrandtia faecavium]|nr:GntR family transcriptional regulator [Candidatus Stackebrandtia faecavium]
MIIEVDHASLIPPYEQVRASLAQQIHDRDLPVGTKLPTVRRLAADLGLAPNTVARAYRQLESAGLIETRGRAGSIVCALEGSGRNELQESAEAYADRAKRLGVDVEEALAIVKAVFER